MISNEFFSVKLPFSLKILCAGNLINIELTTAVLSFKRSTQNKSIDTIHFLGFLINYRSISERSRLHGSNIIKRRMRRGGQLAAHLSAQGAAAMLIIDSAAHTPHETGD